MLPSNLTSTKCVQTNLPPTKKFPKWVYNTINLGACGRKNKQKELRLLLYLILILGTLYCPPPHQHTLEYMYQKYTQFQLWGGPNLHSEVPYRKKQPLKSEVHLLDDFAIFMCLI